MEFRVQESGFYLFIAFSVIGCISSHAISNSLRRRATDGDEITFIRRSGEVVEERVTVGDNEVRFDLEEKTYVFDYEQNLMFFKDVSVSEINRCYVSKLDMKAVGLPYPEEIRNMLQEQREFKMPVDKYPVILEKSENQERPAMLQLTEEICADSELTVLEPKPVVPGNTKALAKATTKKPKGEPGVGWGEVLVIIIVIIILF